MCNVPVTLGGGIWMQNGGAPGANEGSKYPRDSHTGYHFASMAWGSKVFASSMGAPLDASRVAEAMQNRWIIADALRTPLGAPNADGVSRRAPGSREARRLVPS